MTQLQLSLLLTLSNLIEEQEWLSLLLQWRRCHVLVCLLLRENSLKLNLIIIKSELLRFLTNRHALHLHRKLRVQSRRTR